jgi:hypothetical protein
MTPTAYLFYVLVIYIVSYLLMWTHVWIHALKLNTHTWYYLSLYLKKRVKCLRQTNPKFSRYWENFIHRHIGDDSYNPMQTGWKLLE